MRYIKTYTDIKTINYILSLNENLQINEGVIDRLKNMAKKGLLNATVMASLMSNPTFAKEYKTLDPTDKGQIENLIKKDIKGEKSDSLAVDLTNSFGSGKYKLNEEEKNDMIEKIKSIEEYIKKNGGSSFNLTIVSSESRVNMINPDTNKPMEKLELAKLRGNSTYEAIKDYLGTLGVMFKIKLEERQGDVEYDKSELKTMGRDNAVNQEKYKKDQYVRIVINKADFISACSLSDSQSGIKNGPEVDYKIDKEYDISEQLGDLELKLSPGGVPDRAQLFIDGQLVSDTGYFSVGVTSADKTAINYNYIPKYIYELTTIRNKKGSLAVDDTKFVNLEVIHFNTYEDLVKHLLVDPNYKIQGGAETGDYMGKLKSIFNSVKGNFVFYKKFNDDNDTPKLKVKLNGKQGKMMLRIYSPLGQTKYKWSGQCE